MRSHYDVTMFGESFHAFNPNTEGVTDEGHYLKPSSCPICTEEEEAETAAIECNACGCIMDAHDARNPYGASVQVTCTFCEDCGEAGDPERLEALENLIHLQDVGG